MSQFEKWGGFRMSYHVVFEYTEKAGGYAGVRTWTSYESKEHFDSSWAKRNKGKHAGWERILAEGKSADECEAICMQTPLACYEAAALQEMLNLIGAGA